MSTPSLEAGQNISGAASGSPSYTAVQATVTKVSDSVKVALAWQRPWQELADRSAITYPESLVDAQGRINRNVRYFGANYVVAFIAMLGVSLLFFPYSILLILALASLWMYIFTIRTEPLVINGSALSDRTTCLGMLVISFVVIFGLTPIGSLTTVAAAIIFAHATFRTPELVSNDQVGGGGFLSFLEPPLGTLNV